jgi:uncharacterized membrane protein
VRAARLAFILLTSAWVALLAAAPVAALGVPASGLLYAFGSLICHQRPERSFHIDAAQLPVCARCFGLYLGAALGAVAAWHSAGLKPEPIMWRSPSGLRILVLAAAMPTAITWGSELVGLWSPSNPTRFAAALPLGAALAVTVNYIECARLRRTGPSPPRIPI